MGDKMPEFSAIDVAGQVFDYKHSRGKVLMIVFLSGEKKRSDRAASDIEGIVSNFGKNAERLEIVIVVDNPNGLYFQSEKDGPIKDFHILLDSEYKLWGKFGIIAIPTVVISDTNDVILWIKAGHGYDFVPTVRAYLSKALDITQENDPEEIRQVKIVTNDTIMARVKRHLQMAKILEQKGRFESAIAEIHKAKELDPNSVEVNLELGELFCRVGRSKSALNMIEQMRVTKRQDKARVLLISGWAKRQMGDIEIAEKDLLEATKLDVKSGRGFFELGQVYHTKGEKDKAISAYYRALTLVFGGN
ncbi:MAG: tetratricopeptide repeat protein [Planctomycetota bacterium]